jgi:hypothetical protein
MMTLLSVSCYLRFVGEHRSRFLVASYFVPGYFSPVQVEMGLN